MQSLFAYISDTIAGHRNYSESMKKKMAAMGSAVASFVGADGVVGIERLIDADFLMGFGRYLCSGEYAADRSQQNSRGNYSNLSPQTLISHLARLRTVLHEAIVTGLLLAVDLFPAVAKRLKIEFGISDEDMRPLLGNDCTRFAALRAFSFRHEIEKLTSRLLTDSARRADKRKTFPALLYLMGIYSYGLEVNELLELRWDSKSESLVDEEVTVYHPRLKTNVHMPERALRIADMLNKGYAADGYLIRRRPAWIGLSTQAVADKVNASIQALFRSIDVTLLRDGNIRNDWCCLMKECGLNDDLACSLVLGKMIGEDNLRSVLKYGENIFGEHTLFRKRWHVLCSYCRKVDSTMMRGDVAALLKEQGVRFDRNRESYDPRQIEKRVVRGKVVKCNNPAISRYLFVYCTDETARLIEGRMTDSAFMRSLGNRSDYATVSHKEVLAMVNFLKDFRDDVQFVEPSARNAHPEFAEGVRVRILTGPFAGFEGTISQVVSLKSPITDKGVKEGKAMAVSPTTGKYLTEEDTRLYTVQVEGFSMTPHATTHLPGLAMEHKQEDLR